MEDQSAQGAPAIDTEHVRRTGPVVRGAGWLCTGTGTALLLQSVIWTVHSVVAEEVGLGMEEFRHLQLIWGAASGVVALLLVLAGWRLRVAGRAEDARMSGALTLGFVATGFNVVLPLFWWVYYWATLPTGMAISLGAGGFVESLIPMSLLLTAWWMLRRPPVEGAAGGRRFGWRLAAGVALGVVAAAKLVAVGSQLASLLSGPMGGVSIGGPGGGATVCAVVPGLLAAAVAGGVAMFHASRNADTGPGTAALSIVAVLLLLLGEVVGVAVQVDWMLSIDTYPSSADWIVPWGFSMAASLIPPLAVVALVIRAFLEPVPATASAAAAAPAAPAGPLPG